MNTLCVISGSYDDISPLGNGGGGSGNGVSNDDNLDDLIKQYCNKYDYKLINSSDGNECCQIIEKYCDLKSLINTTTTSAITSNNNNNNCNDTTSTYDDNTTILTAANANGTLLSNGNSSTMNGGGTISLSGSSKQINGDCIRFTCFILPDFSHQDDLFNKLEDIQNKYSNNQHRVIIYGMPVLVNCNLQNTVTIRIKLV